MWYSRRGLDEHMQGHGGRAFSLRSSINCGNRLRDIGKRFHFGNHDVGQRLSGLTHHNLGIREKKGMTYRMQARTDTMHFLAMPGLRCGPLRIRQLHHTVGLLHFGTGWCAVFAVQCDIKHTGTKFLCHLCLHLQALLHPRFHTAVVVTYRQEFGCTLCSQQYLARMKRGRLKAPLR